MGGEKPARDNYIPGESPAARFREVAADCGFDIIRTMTKMMKEAIAVLRELPEERQETIARAIFDYASADDGVYHLTDAERREVRAGPAEGDCAS